MLNRPTPRPAPIKTAIAHAIHIPIDEAMRIRARCDGDLRQMRRTRASPYDAYIGTLGELVWVKLRHGHIENFDTLNTRGQVDDVAMVMHESWQIEVKTSKTRISPYSHLMVREDYAQRRQPDVYVLVLLPQSQPIYAERDAFVCGWATHAEVIARPLRERHSHHTGQAQGFRCHEIPVRELRPLSELPFELSGANS